MFVQFSFRSSSTRAPPGGSLSSGRTGSGGRGVAPSPPLQPEPRSSNQNRRDTLGTATPRSRLQTTTAIIPPRTRKGAAAPSSVSSWLTWSPRFEPHYVSWVINGGRSPVGRTSGLRAQVDRQGRQRGCPRPSSRLHSAQASNPRSPGLTPKSERSASHAVGSHWMPRRMGSAVALVVAEPLAERATRPVLIHLHYAADGLRRRSQRQRGLGV